MSNIPEDLIHRLETSFALFAGKETELIETFYSTLFESAPSVRTLFPNDMAAQKQKLLASLALVVKNLRKLDEITPALKQMGARHVGYGTEDAHYAVVRDVMVSAMEEVGGEGWSVQYSKDWRAALDLVSGVMIAGAHEAQKNKAA